MRVDAASREITCKVVYYGPGMSGKTTNLKQIRDRAPSRSVGDLVTLDTHSERTLHFDLLPMDLGTVNGYHIRFEFYTVPGQSYYASTRKLVLDGADAVVFVADSRREALDENIDSMNDLLDNVRHLQLGDELPVIMQYNKQDLPSALKPEQLEPLLNSRRWPSQLAVATTGAGVLETLKLVSDLVMQRAKAAASGGTTPSGSAPLLAPPPPASNRPQTWLISCFRCQNMLEITGAKVGDLFVCGACRTTLQIVDLDRGLTQAPPPQPSPAAAPPPPPPQPRGQQPAARAQQAVSPFGEESGGYSLQPLTSPASALNIGSGANVVQSDHSLGAGAFDLEGFDQISLLDENVQGRRLRVRNRSDGISYRAMVISPNLLRQPGYATQVENYVRLAAQIRHQHILPIHSLHQGRETPILLSQDPADHESLAHVMARRRVLAPPHAMAVTRQIALACEEASRRGVVHGWLRPDVVLLNAESQVVVDEFGVLKHHRFLVHELAGASAATEYYLAPEHLGDDARSDVRSDMFQLGALIFRMITGEGLVTGYTAHEALHKVAATGCRTLRSVQPQASRDLDAFVSRLTSIERKDRPQAWSEVLEVCDRFGGGARHQTFRVTQPINAPVGSAQVTRSHGRPLSGGTGTVTRTLHGGTASLRREPQSGIRHPTNARSRNDGSNGVLIMLVVLLLVAAAGFVIWILSRPAPYRPTATDDKAPPTAARSAPTLPPTPAIGPKGADPRLPGFMGGGPATAGAAAGKSEPPAKDKPTVQPGDPAYTDLIQQIAQAEREQRYRDAITLCDRLPAESRQTRIDDVHFNHLARRAEVAKLVKQAASLDVARSLVEPALNTWNLPGDKEWAQQTMQFAGSEAVVKPVATVPAPVPPTPTPPAAAKSGAFAETAWLVEQALAKHQIPAAEQAAATLAAGPEAAAVMRRIELWNDRAQILATGLSERNPVARITNPTDGQLWDVTGAEKAGLNVTSPTGSSTRMDWAQVPIKALAQVAMAVADSATPPKPREAALAVVTLSAANDMALAIIQLRKAKAVLTPELLAELETSVALHLQYENTDLITRADEAAKSGNAKLLGECLDQLHKGERPKDLEVAAALPRLDEMYKRLQEGKSADNSAPLRDHLTFDREEDLNSLPLRDGEWAVESGKLVPGGTKGWVRRKDLATGKSMTLIFQAAANRGALTVDFRGVRVLLDLAKGTLLAATREQEMKPQDVQIIPRTAYTLYIELRGQGRALIELNNGVVSLDPRIGKPTDQLDIAFDTGASVSFDELTLTREAKLDPAAEAQRIAAIVGLGFEPIGQACLVPPNIVLPNSSPRSGIAITRREGRASITFEAKGKGKLEVRFGKLGEGGGQVVDLDLGATPDQTVKYTVSWTGGVVQVRKGDPTDPVFIEDRLQGDPPHVMIIAQQEAMFVSTPRVNRQ